ncbi:MAG: peptidase MA family metallohydrolase [Ardenticatenales bacterium]
MHHLIAALATVLAAAVAPRLAAAPPSAPAPIVVIANDGTFSFAERLVFRLEARSDERIRDVVLRFRVADGEVINRRIPEFTPGNRIVARQTEPSPRGAIPPSSEIRWWWDVTTVSGAHLKTPERTLRYMDQRYGWVSRDVDGIRLWSYSLEDKDAAALASSAVASLKSIRDQSGLAVERPVNIVAYASQDDLRPALLGRGDTYESRLATLGARVADDVVVLDAGSRSVALATVLRHELTHVAVHLHMSERWIDVPSWLDEGLAMYMEGPLDGVERRSLDQAIRADELMSVRSMTSFPGDASLVSLAYGESEDIVAYLLEAHGRAKLAALFDALATGDDVIDDALTNVYGFDQLGLYQTYRRARGLAPASTPAPGVMPPGLAGSGSAGSGGGGSAPDAPARPTSASARARRLSVPVAAALAGLLGLAAIVVFTTRARNHAPSSSFTAKPADDPAAADPGAPETVTDAHATFHARADAATAPPDADAPPTWSER